MNKNIKIERNNFLRSFLNLRNPLYRLSSDANSMAANLDLDAFTSRWTADIENPRTIPISVNLIIKYFSNGSI